LEEKAIPEDEKMMARRYLSLILALGALGFLIGCGGDEPGPSAEDQQALTAFVSILPQAYFVERIGGERVDVQVMVKPGHSPHAYEPTPRQMTALAGADAYFLIGVPFEDVVKDRIQSANPEMRMVNTGRGIELRAGEDHHHEGEHEEEHARDHEGESDPHTWLSPLNVKTMAQHIADALVDLDPAHEQDYRANLAAFLADLDELDAAVRERCSGLTSREFMVFHPAFGYFADAYGLKQIPIEVEGKEPGAQTLAQLIEMARERGIKVVFVQKQLSQQSAEVVAREIGGRVVAVDPLERDYLAGIRRIADAFAESME
jgi:zinc transport system substrate-binding protein